MSPSQAASLDFGNQGRVINEIRALKAAAGHGVLFTTHDPNHAMRAADRVYLLRVGVAGDSEPDPRVTRTAPGPNGVPPPSKPCGRMPHGRLILTVLGGLAEFERHLIAARTSEGRKRARANGVLFGRPRKLTPHQAREALKRVDAGEPLREIALSFNVDHSTISRLKARHAAEV
jgi:energy-coupling factor transporter ATP-binding protein EcfA2